MYLALARKYRPQKFEDLIGQPHITKTLQNAINMNKLYPGLIFSGMKGVGKTSTARILAKALNCEKGPAIEPCNECQICIEITEDKSTDYIEIDGASNNGVEEVRSLKEKVKYKPFKNRYRVVVIDEVHMLSSSAWNALLKTIEEPPEHTYFIMATTDFHKIPSTIVSRCQHFEFKRIPYEVINTVLKEISLKENIKISDYALFIISKSSDGSLRDAKKILDQAIALSKGNVKDKDVIEILGIIEEEIFIKLTNDVLNQNRKEIIERINILSERGMDLRFFYSEYLKFFRDLIILKSLDESEQLHNLNPENVPEIKEMIKEVREIELLRYFNAAKDLEQTMKNTENPRIMLEYLFLKFSYFPSLASIEDLIKKVGTNKSLLTVHEEKEADASRADKIEMKNEPYKPDKELIKALIERMEKEKPRLASALKSSVIKVINSTFMIEFPANLTHVQKKLEEHTSVIKEILSEITKSNVEVNAVMSQNKDVKDEVSRIKELKSDKKINNLKNKIKGKVISIESIEGGPNA